jgi:hypothetical protein
MSVPVSSRSRAKESANRVRENRNDVTLFPGSMHVCMYKLSCYSTLSV